MASTFRPVNPPPMTLQVEKRDGEGISPTTPPEVMAALGQRPLPTSPFPQAVHIPEGTPEDHQTPQCKGSKRSPGSRSGSEDINMGDNSGEEGHVKEENHVSDGESVNGDGSRSNKKKKGQRFFCTGFAPCKLSFTRSEHLARHIRKHTGERPFQCHCSRRFSRLDNLRQHAQTVHLNEEIPHDSPAASSTRFQRQGRPDRARQPGRARAATAGTLSAPTRRHVKSLSASSIGPMGSSFSAREDMRPRPPSLIMPEPGHPYSVEVYLAPQPSPGDFNTPPSATFSNGQGSPHWDTAAISPPSSSHTRAHSLYATSQIPARRLSVPSSAVPFQFQLGAAPNRPVIARSSPFVPDGSQVPPLSSTGSTLAWPTSSVFSRREPTIGAEDWRRRTWHPPGNHLTQMPIDQEYSSPRDHEAPHPWQEQSEAPIRLPGIESFGVMPYRPSPSARNQAPPTTVERNLSHPSARRPSASLAEIEERRGTTDWVMGLHRGLTRLDITSKPANPDGASRRIHEPNEATEMEARRVQPSQPAVRLEALAMPGRPAMPPAATTYHQYTMSAPSIASARDSKRRPWYQGGASTDFNAPPGRSSRLSRMIHPNMGQFRGFMTREMPSSGSALDPALSPAPHEEYPDEGRTNARFDVLVAAATSESNGRRA